jgi:hypothetical protein
MKLLLDIEDSKVSFIMELLKNFRFVKVNSVETEDVRIYKELEESVEQMNLISERKLNARPVEELLNEI